MLALKKRLLQKRRREIHLAHRAKTLKPKINRLVLHFKTQCAPDTSLTVVEIACTCTPFVKGTGEKSKGRPRTGNEGPEGEEKYSAILLLTW